MHACSIKYTKGVSAQKQSSGLHVETHENSTFVNLALSLAVSVSLWRKSVPYSTLNVHIIKYWSMFGMLMQKNTSLCGLFSHTPQQTPQVKYDHGRISA